jgi:hypothetical protein
MREWAGGTDNQPQGTQWHRSKLERLYMDTADKVAEEYALLINRPARRLFNTPGPRLALAHDAYEVLAEKLATLINMHQTELDKLKSESSKSYDKVGAALDEVLQGTRSFSFFPAKRMQRLLGQFLESVTKFCRDRLAEFTLRSVGGVYQALLAKISDLQRDLKFIHQRLRHLEHSLLTAAKEHDLTSASMETLGGQKAKKGEFDDAQMSSSQILRDAALVLASRIVLPHGQTDLEQAAGRFLQGVPDSAWAELDQYLQDHVLKQMGGLFSLCMNNSDLPRTLNGPLLQGTAAYLNQHLEVTDVCQAELSTAQTLGVDLSAQTKVFHHLATPSITTKSPVEVENDFLLVPNTRSGEEFTKLALRELPNLQVMPVGVVTDIFIAREQGSLTLADLQQVFAVCKPEYDQNKSSLVSSPHSRMDMLDWLSIDD